VHNPSQMNNEVHNFFSKRFYKEGKNKIAVDRMKLKLQVYEGYINSREFKMKENSNLNIICFSFEIQ